MNTSLLSSPALTLGLALLAPVFFVFSRNSHMVNVKGLLLASGIMFLTACLLVLFAAVCIRFVRKLPGFLPDSLSPWLRLLALAAVCVALVALSGFFLHEVLHEAFPGSRWLRILVSRILPFMLLFPVALRFGFGPVNVFLCVFLGISAANLGIALADKNSMAGDASLLSYTIEEKPNIYLFFLESYHSLDIQRDVYGIDTADMETYLAENGFTDYGKIYSNSSHTLASFADTFSFNLSWMYERGNNDVAADVRLMLGGDERNTLFRILKANGYTTVWITGHSRYYGSLRGEFLDESDYLVPDPRRSVIEEARTSFEMLNSRLGDSPVLAAAIRYRPARTEDSGYSGSLENRVAHALTRHQGSASPLFITFKGGAGHTSNWGYSWQEHAGWVRSGRYQGLVEQGNQEFRRICDMILAQDPGALIIAIGDHGAWRFRGIEGSMQGQSLAVMAARVAENGVSWLDFCEDRFAAFLAVRLPYGEQADISHNRVMSHVNLFRHVFAHLNGDASILETRAPSDSHMHGHRVIREGAVVDVP